MLLHILDLVSVSDNFCRILMKFGIVVLDKVCPARIYYVAVIFY